MEDGEVEAGLGGEDKEEVRLAGEAEGEEE